MNRDLFTGEDLRKIKDEGMTPENVLAQLELFKAGSFPVRLNRPCTLNDGIRVLSEEEREECVRVYDEAVRRGRIMKFVPASGAASRMFQDWCSAYQAGDFRFQEESLRFISDLRKFAFYEDLLAALSRDGLDFETLAAGKRFDVILDYVLTPRGLNYASLPKALLKFHRYPRQPRTSLEEHLVEGALYVRDERNICRIHFTVSEEHRSAVSDFISGVRGSCESLFGVRFDIGISTQRSSTQTIAADPGNRPFRDRSGALVFRPGGHGSLLENLNALDGAVVMVKNIDNVVPDRLKDETVFYKKVLGGYLIRLQNESFRYLEGLSGGASDDEGISRAALFCRHELSGVFPSGFGAFSREQKKAFLVGKLNRPIRVCGMVKNQGEPGGGPFWVEEEDGTQTLQIIEEAQIDQGSVVQMRKWRSSTHFNPVDLACGIRDFRGEKFDLRDFVDKKAYLISKKSQDGMDMKALELPGLWNGSMACWNTVFIEVPVGTFNPVKTVYDLLRPQHLPS